MFRRTPCIACSANLRRQLEGQNGHGGRRQGSLPAPQRRSGPVTPGDLRPRVLPRLHHVGWFRPGLPLVTSGRSRASRHVTSTLLVPFQSRKTRSFLARITGKSTCKRRRGESCLENTSSVLYCPDLNRRDAYMYLTTNYGSIMYT